MLMLLFLWGCIEFTIDPVDPDAPPDRVLITDSFRQEALPAVDLLFVVDNTASMSSERRTLASEFPQLADRLSDEGVRWQAGVITTEATGPRAGWLVGDPWIITASMPDAAERFAANAQVGGEGTSPEAGVRAALMALDLVTGDGPNAGFRRPDAGLHIVFVSDSDDQSQPGTADAVDELLSELQAEAAASGLPAFASAIVGDVPDGCLSPLGSAEPGLRYSDLALRSGGAVVSICAPDFGPLLSSIAAQSITYRTRFWLVGDPVVDSLRVSVDGVRWGSGWAHDSLDNAIVFELDDVPPPGATIDVEYLIEVAAP